MIGALRGLWHRHRLPPQTIATFTSLMQQPASSKSMVPLSRKLPVDSPALFPSQGLFSEKKEGDAPNNKQAKDKKKKQGKKKEDDDDHKGGGLLQPIFEELEELVKRRMPKPRNSM